MPSKINIEVDTVPSHKLTKSLRRDLNTAQMAEEIRRAVQHRANQGFTLRAMGSRGGAMYLVFAEKIK